MKLYAKTTSERASKGQGGNQYLDIELTIGNEKHRLGKIEMRETYGGFISVFFKPEERSLDGSNDILLIMAQTQGKSQKGEKVKLSPGAYPLQFGGSAKREDFN